MDEVEMDCNGPLEVHLEKPSEDVVFKTPLILDRNKLHPMTMYESSGYHSASPDLISPAESIPCSAQVMIPRCKSNLFSTANSSSESQLSISPESCVGRSNVLRLGETSPDSGLGCESFCSSTKDVTSGEDDILTHSSPSAKCASLAVPKDLGLGLWQSTPVVPELRNVRPTFTHSIDLEPSPTKRRRAEVKRPSRDIFQKKVPVFPRCLLDLGQPCLVGQETVDFLYCLGKRQSHQPALDAILRQLDPVDLCRASLVSRTWKAVIENVPRANQRKKEYVEMCSQIKENLPQPVQKAEGVLPRRGQLISIQNLNRTEEVTSSNQRSPPVSPSKVRFNLYLKEGRKLESGQTLVPCPQCKLPSRKETERSAICTRRGCQYHFCIVCRCSFHAEKPCPVSSVRHRKRSTAIGSRESKRNLQRLCK